jgi:hypothetical protein
VCIHEESLHGGEAQICRAWTEDHSRYLEVQQGHEKLIVRMKPGLTSKELTQRGYVATEVLCAHPGVRSQYRAATVKIFRKRRLLFCWRSHAFLSAATSRNGALGWQRSKNLTGERPNGWGVHLNLQVH